MKLISYFNAFLSDVVNLNPGRLAQLDARTTAIINFLKQDEVFGPLLKTHIPQGSRAQKTIIKPKSGGHFDAAELIHLDPVPDWDACGYVGKLYTALGRSSVYKDMRHRRTRCVYIDYADECHIDLVPYVEDGGQGYITNYKDNCFHLTDPKGFTGWLKEQNRITGGNLIKVIRLLKYVRDHRYERTNFPIKSVILTTLLGGRVNEIAPLLETGCYADVPATLRTLVRDLNSYLQSNPTLPYIADPGGSGDNLADRWSAEEYRVFRDKFKTLAAKVEEAYVAETVDDSLAAWQGVFGTKFKAPAVTVAKSASSLTEAAAPVTERFLDVHFGIPFELGGHTVQMRGYVKPKAGYRHGPLSTFDNRVPKGVGLAFIVESCTVREPYEIYWKVRNTGLEAAASNALRGEIRNDRGSAITESTLYAGDHWVECYIVRDEVCVARSRQQVIIT
jgi:hypothetical protein